MHHSSYDASTRFETLAAERTASRACDLLAAAETFRRSVADCLEGWEDEVAAGDSLRRPGDFDDVAALFALADDAVRLAQTASRRRDLSFVLATAKAA